MKRWWRFSAGLLAVAAVVLIGGATWAEVDDPQKALDWSAVGVVGSSLLAVFAVVVGQATARADRAAVRQLTQDENDRQRLLAEAQSKDEARRVLYIANATCRHTSGRVDLSADLEGTLMNTLVHHHRLLTIDEAMALFHQLRTDSVSGQASEQLLGLIEQMTRRLDDPDFTISKEVLIGHHLQRSAPFRIS